MSGTAQNLDREFWRPPVPTPLFTAGRPTELCPGCNHELVAGGRFCHNCGASRNAPTGTPPRWDRYLNTHSVREALGLSVGALVAFCLGLGFAALAVGTGLVYSANTLVDWQAVQIWRIEWLLASVVAFVAGILLKRKH